MDKPCYGNIITISLAANMLMNIHQKSILAVLEAIFDLVMRVVCQNLFIKYKVKIKDYTIDCS